ncbi:MAG TPA: efflux RND transporter periplasmic adaptor subunit [Thermoanaerobaculia bacterium]|nr:efflux RND transporter periplasmic adaptor subunit [Thermoanaerobaculia bacterium]
MIRIRAARALLCVLTWAAATRCSEKPDAAAAETPQLEVRAAVAAPQTAIAISTIDGRIATLLVKEGQLVQPGATIATLTNAGVDRDIAYAKAQVAVAQQRLRDARRPVIRTVVPGDNAARERASAQILRNAEARRARYRELYATHDVSKQELEDAETAYAAALRDSLNERERATQHVLQTDTGLLQLELERAQAELAYASDRRALLEVKAPMGGIVTRVVARPGQNIFPRDPIVEIANTATVEVRGTIASELTRYVRVGLPVETKVFTVPPRRFTVPVKNVLPGNGGATLVVELPNPDGVLQEGQTAVVTVK